MSTTLLSSPLGMHVPPQVRAAIKEGMFIEMSQLALPSAHTPSQGEKKQKPPVPMPMGEFSSLFHTYIAIRAESHPADAVGMLKHLETVHQLNSLFGSDAWRFYDRHFRLAKQYNPSMPWGVTNLEIYMQATAMGLKPGANRTRSGRTNDKRSFQHNKPLRPNTCWTFQNKGYCDRKPCNFPMTHSCYNCQGAHATFQCTANAPAATATEPQTSSSRDTSSSQQAQPFRGRQASSKPANQSK
jgi:hypothetical protein